MEDFRDRDLTAARFTRVRLSRAAFTDVHLDHATLRDVDLSGADLRGALLQGVRMRGVELVDVDISGELEHLVVNGVDVAPLVEAELDRRRPERALLRATDAEGFRRAWAMLEQQWESTVARARTFPDEDLHRSVDGEWSFVQTLRHLGFATAAWVQRMAQGDPSPWHPWDLPWDEAPGWEGIPWDREVRPALDDVLALRAERQSAVRAYLRQLGDEQLAVRVSRTEPGFPRERDFPLAQCLRIVLKEEWEHRLYAERDLSAIEREG